MSNTRRARINVARLNELARRAVATEAARGCTCTPTVAVVKHGVKVQHADDCKVQADDAPTDDAPTETFTPPLPEGQVLIDGESDPRIVRLDGPPRGTP